MYSRIDLSGQGSSSSIGLNSKLNVEGLIEKRIAVLKKPLEEIDAHITLNTDKIQAYTELKKIMGDLYEVANSLRYVPGIQVHNAFDSRKAYISTNSGTDPGIYANITAENGATITSFDLTVNQLAQPLVQQSVAFSSKTNSATNAIGDHSVLTLFTPGTFKLNGIDITINSGDSLIDIAANLNYASKQTGVTATVFEPILGQVRLILQSQQTGAINGYTIVDNNNVWNNVLRYDPVLNPNCNLKTAQDCILGYDGIQDIQRPSNLITDCLDGIVINAYQITPLNTRITVDVTYDLAGVVRSIQKFVDSYNAMCKFVANQQQTDTDGQYVESAKIRDGTVLDGFMMTAQRYLTTTNNLNVEYPTIFDIGISFIDVMEDVITKDPAYRNLLALDVEALQSALDDNFDEVRRLFEFHFNSSSSKLLPTRTRSNNLPSNVTNMVFTINTSNTSNPSAVLHYTQNDSSYSTHLDFRYFDPQNPGNGGTMNGVIGSILEGFSFIYIGNGQDTISVDITQGLADQIYNALAIVNSSGGIIDMIQDVIRTENTQYKDDRQFIESDIENEKQSMIKRFAKMDAYISQTNTQLSFIEAMSNVRER